jgi:hypothetical protein
MLWTCGVFALLVFPMLSAMSVLLDASLVQQARSAWPAARLALPAMQARSAPQSGVHIAPPVFLEATAALAKRIALSAFLARTTPRPEVHPAAFAMQARSTPQSGVHIAPPVLLEATAALAKRIALSALRARITPLSEVSLHSTAPLVMLGRTTPLPEAALYQSVYPVTQVRSVPPLLLWSAPLALLALTAPTNVPQKDFRAMRATSALQDPSLRPRVHQAASARRMRGPRRLAPKTRTANQANWHPRRSVRRALPAKSPGLVLWRARRPASRARGTCRRSSATPRKARWWWC